MNELRNLSSSSLSTLASINISNPNAVIDAVNDSNVSNVASMALDVPLVPTSEIPDMSFNTPNLNIADFDAIALAYSDNIDLEDKLSEQFAYSTAVMGVQIDTELALNGGTLSSDFRANLASNHFVKFGAYINDSISTGLSLSFKTGLVDVNIAVSLDDFTTGVDDLLVELDVLSLEVTSLASLAVGVTEIFGLESEFIDFVSDALNVVNTVQAALVVGGAIVNGLAGYALTTPEPITKVVAAVVTLTLQFIAIIGAANTKDKIATAQRRAEVMNVTSLNQNYMSLMIMYDNKFKEILKTVNADHGDSPPILRVQLVGTSLEISYNFEVDNDLIQSISDYSAGLLSGVVSLKSYGKSLLYKESFVDIVRKSLSSKVFSGGFYGRFV